MDYLFEKLHELASLVLDIIFYIVNFMLMGTTKLLRMLDLSADLTSHTTLAYLLAIIILAAFTYFTAKLVSKWIYNSIVGLVGLFILRMIGFDLPITLFTIVVVALFGLGGLVALLVLYVAGVFPPF